MVLRRLLFNLLNNPQVIEKLSESRPIRRAAQLTAYAVMKAQLSGKDVTQRLLRSDTVRQIQQEVVTGPGALREVGRRVQRVKDSLLKEVRSGMQNAKRQIKRGGSR
ncbi:protein NCBP2AS2 [Spea bombifrons]|uniref:protein NCBP2AS2 n=1 Tax=Spea bombifrons TaxID=233779 RepID=UPI00234BFFB3|nr:protein NCBP2AS2 [Spea bombifrons]